MPQPEKASATRSTLVVWAVITGIAFGVGAVLLARLGNPPNMGLCSACFLRDTAGGLQLFAKPAGLQFLRPEVPGLVLGAFLAALVFGGFRARGGSSPALRFLLGALMMFGALVFLGCPLRMMLRLAGGDWLTGGVGLLGLVAGVGAGTFCLRRGFSLGSGRDQARATALVGPLLALALVTVIVRLALTGEDPRGLLTTKWSAPIFASLGVALVLGFLAQRSGFCSVGGFRDALMGERSPLVVAYLALIPTLVVGNLVVQIFIPGPTNQFAWGAAPIAHSVHHWGFLGMALVGFAAILVGGCPLRQMVAAGQGDGDAVLTLLGLLAGAALAHNFELTAAPAPPGSVGYVAPAAGMVVLGGLALCAILGLTCRRPRPTGGSD